MAAADPGSPPRSPDEVARAVDRLVATTRHAPDGPQIQRGWGLDLWPVDPSDGDGLTSDELHRPELTRNVAHQMVASGTLARLVADLDQPVTTFKGLAAAAAWPEPAARRAGDVDVLVADADAAWARLVERGWTLLPGDDGDWDERHHREHWHAWPLIAPDGGPPVEIHRRGPWPRWVDRAPSAAQLCARAGVPVTSGLPDGVLVPDPVDHVLLMTAASWGHVPFEQMRQLVDLAFLGAVVDAAAVDARAREIGLARLVRTTRRATGHVLWGEPAPLAWRLLGRPLRRGRIGGHPPLRRAAGAVLVAPPASLARLGSSRVRRGRPADAT